MKATLFLSSLFFLLGLKISNLVDLRGKANVVDQIIVNKIINSKPVKALPLFNDSEQETEKKEEIIPAEPTQKENETESNTKSSL